MNTQAEPVPITMPVYYDEPYLTELYSKVLRIELRGSQHVVELQSTIFYPEGGGQPSDQGQIVGEGGYLRVEQVRNSRNASILHQGKLSGELEAGENVKMTIKWPARYKNMRVHSAGHLIHDVLMTISQGLTPTKGNHGPKAFLEYSGILDPEIKLELEVKTNEMIDQDVAIVTRYTDYREIVETCRFVPPGLPQNKPLRLIQIGDFDPMPDGGVQVKSTKEIGRVILHNISPIDGGAVIRYGVV
jgi:alanyl-tRNA synthetase